MKLHKIYTIFVMQFIILLYSYAEEAKSKSISFAPMFGYDSGYGAILGAAAFILPNDERPYRIDVQLLGTFKNVFSLYNLTEHYLNNKYIVGGELYFSNFYINYFGEGGSTQVNSLEEIDSDKMLVRPFLKFNIDKYNGLKFSYAYDQIKFKEEFSFEDEKAEVLGLELFADHRDSIWHPTSGYRVSYEMDYSKVESKNKKYIQNKFNASYFMKPNVLNSVLGFNGFIGKSNGPSELYLSKFDLGGNALRGYYGNRFRDIAMIYGQVEWRVPVVKSGNIRGVIFTDIGSIGSSFDDLGKDQSPWHLGKGVGLRFLLPPDRKMSVRVDLGFGSDQQTTSVSFGDVF